VVLWSSGSVKSEWVKTEASEGNRRSILVPVMIEDVLLPLAFRRIEAAKLIDWDGTSDHEEFDLLVESVTRIVGRAPEVEKQEAEKKDREKQAKREAEKKEKEDQDFTNSIGMKFALIPAGEFMMGSEEFDWVNPVHRVKISKPFYLGIYPVTQSEWKDVKGNNPSNFKGNKLPVETVSWNDVQEFIKKLNQTEAPDKYRLPSEAEWEYAACAGTKTRYSFGDDESNLGEYAWYAENSGARPPKKGVYSGYDKKDWDDNKWNGKTHPVGEKKPNTWGLYDMHGNVWEWVQDSWHENYNGAPTDGSSWESGGGSVRVGRGGSWRCNAGGCRSAYRYGFNPGACDADLGFRLVRIL